MRTQASFRMHVCGGLGLLLGVIGLVSAEDRAGNKSKLPKKSAEVEKAAPYSDYSSWKSVNAEPRVVTPTQKRACEGSDRHAHVGDFINVYVNPVGRDQYLKAETPVFEAGSVIVKEKLRKKDDKEPQELGVMIKREAGFAPMAGDWEFLLVDGKGNVSNQQELQKSCAACHRMRAKEDYVFRKAIADVPARGREDANSRRSTPRGNAREP